MASPSPSANLNGIKWDDESQSSGPQAPSDGLGIQWDSDKYGSTGQQILTATEGAAQGFAGPLATGAERALSTAGIPGLTPEDQAMRARVNPATHTAAEIAGFGAGALSGVGEAAALGKIGEAAQAVSGLTKATLASRLALQGIKTGSEIAALQAGNEASKFINSDPNQTLGSAAINIGLSGLLGAATGVPLGGVSELWTKGLDKADDLINDVKSRVAYRQALESGETGAEVAEGVAKKPVFDPFTKKVVEATEGETLPEHGAETAGTKLGDWLFDKGRTQIAAAGARSAGEAAGEGAGALAGLLVGHPIIGGYVGGKILGPAVSAIAKPMLERVTDGASLKGSLDYLSNAIKGDNLLTKTVEALFKGSEVLTPNMLPDAEDRNRLQKSLDSLNTPEAAMQHANGLSHYLPEHAVAAGSLIGQAKNYLDSLKPQAEASTPFNTAQTTHWQQAAYDRALDLAEQPLLALKKVQNGSLTPADVATLDTLYPGLRRGIADKVQNELIKKYASGEKIPYQIRSSLGLLLGSTPMDGSLSSFSMQAIMKANGTQQAVNQSNGKTHKQQGTTAAQLKEVDRVTDLYSNNPRTKRAERR